MTDHARWLAVAAWMSIIFVFSATPHLRVSDEAGLDFLIRKAGHLVVFGALAILFFAALPPRTRWRVVVAAVLTTLYAVSDELHQSFVAGRGPAATDVAIDTVGALVALALWERVRSRWVRAR